MKKKYEEIEGELLLERESTMSEMQAIKDSLVQFHSQLEADQQKFSILVADADSYHRVGRVIQSTFRSIKISHMGSFWLIQISL